MLIDKELYDKFFREDSRNNFVNIDINTFEVFNELYTEGKLKVNRHKTFAFAYYCLVSYFWKYSKYDKQEINAQDIKRILNINPIEKRLDYIVKKKGVLDSVGLTKTTREFPIETSFNEMGEIKVTTLGSIDPELAKLYLAQYNSRYTCKKPLLQYSREDKDGLMYSRDNTLSISVFELSRTLLCPSIGFDGFYIYLYLKYRNKMLGYKGLDIYYTELVREIGYEKRRIRELIGNLKKAGMVVIESIFENEDNKISRRNSYKVVSPINQPLNQG